VVEKPHASGGVNYLFKIQPGPTVENRCPECDSALHVRFDLALQVLDVDSFNQVAGPMWSGPLHDPDFTAQVLKHLEANTDKYGTAVRMKGMLTVAKEVCLSPFWIDFGFLPHIVRN
jgi:tRNA (guanine26-N2/guanine27-N2)-dimethyltransferase